tara:strand:- start:670 stop:1338 length:669 start_codon:yes stop_codon:yes gene_type:complete
MLTKGIRFKNYKLKIKSSNLVVKLNSILNEKNEILNSLSRNYKNKFFKKKIKKYTHYSNFKLIGMGGSTLGTQAIYEFLKKKIKKKFIFIDNLQPKQIIDNKKKFLNIIISKSGNTIETIANVNIHVKKNDKNIFITENKKNSLFLLAEKLKSEIIHHNNYIGGRYSVLSEVGMLPAELMGLKIKQFKQFNLLVKNKKFINSLISNVNATYSLIKKKNLILL